MENKKLRKPAEIPNVDSSPKNAISQGLFSGTGAKNLVDYFPGLLQQLGAAKSPGDAQTPSGSPKPPVKTMFGGINASEVVKAVQEFNQAKGRQAEEAISHTSGQGPAVPLRLSTIPTAEVIASLLNVKKNKRVKPSTLETYDKRLAPFQQAFPFLPENKEAITCYLSRFNGPSGRHQRNQQDILNMLYVHAGKYFGLKCNPVAELERPLVRHKPVKTLTLEKMRILNQTPQSLAERTALDLLAGHGWRQVEVRRTQAQDVTAIEDLQILCHGKEREETSPLLPETAERLREMARGLAPQDYLFRAEQTRHGHRAQLGDDGMARLIMKLYKRAGLQGYTGHDLRRSFATLVTTASHDEFLALRLIRDSVPGMSNLYIRYPLDQLVESLQKYSPLRQLGESKSNPESQPKPQTPPSQTKDSPVSETRKSLQKTQSERKNNLVETGEGRAPSSQSLGSLLKERRALVIQFVM